MRTIKIVESFTGYPSGKKRFFEKGEEPEVPDDFADLAVAKGHAKEDETKGSGRQDAAEQPAKRSART